MYNEILDSLSFLDNLSLFQIILAAFVGVVLIFVFVFVFIAFLSLCLHILEAVFNFDIGTLSEMQKEFEDKHKKNN